MSSGHHQRAPLRGLLGATLIALALVASGCEWSGCSQDAPERAPGAGETSAPTPRDAPASVASDEQKQAAATDNEVTDPDADNAPPQWSEGDGVDEAFTGHLARGDWRLVGFAASEADGADAGDATSIEVIVDRGEPDARPLRKPIESCDAFFAAVRQHASPREAGPAGFELTLDFGRARFDDHVLFDLRDDFCAELEPAGQASVDQITGSRRLLSQVGPIVTIERIESRSQNRNLPRLSTQWATIDLRTNQPADWATLVTEDSLLKALQDAPAIAQSRAARRVARAGSLDAAISAIESSWGVFGGWAFHSWDPDRDRAVIHVAFYDKKTRQKPPRLRQLALTVTPRDEHRHFFDKARAGDAGFLMSIQR